MVKFGLLQKKVLGQDKNGVLHTITRFAAGEMLLCTSTSYFILCLSFNSPASFATHKGTAI